MKTEALSRFPGELIHDPTLRTEPMELAARYGVPLDAEALSGNEFGKVVGAVLARLEVYGGEAKDGRHKQEIDVL